MTRAELHEIVDELPEEAVDGASLLLRRIASGQIDPSQAWVWTDEWQAKLRVSLADLERGRVTRFNSDEEFLNAL